LKVAREWCGGLGVGGVADQTSEWRVAGVRPNVRVGGGCPWVRGFTGYRALRRSGPLGDCLRGVLEHPGTVGGVEQILVGDDLDAGQVGVLGTNDLPDDAFVGLVVGDVGRVADDDGGVHPTHVPLLAELVAVGGLALLR
jgi:hypothetical protein